MTRNAVSGELHPRGVAEGILTTLDSVPSSMKTSMQRDPEGGRRLEPEAFAGALRRAGGSNGVPTPVHDILYAVLGPAALAADAGYMTLAFEQTWVER
jgi:2-dehydropantoate 2-reductase